MFIPLIFIFIGFFLLYKVFSTSKKTQICGNKYIENHEKKIQDDVQYEEYMEWCKRKGEIALEKEGYDEYRMKEYMMYKKLMKYGLKGLK